MIAPDGRKLSYGELVANDMLHVQAQASSKLKDPSTFKVMGQSIPRVDIPAKVTGGVAYVQDLRLPGMVHARVVRPPSYGAQLTDCDTAGVEKLPGFVKVVRDGNFLAVVARGEFQAVKAMQALSAAAKWKENAQLPKQDDLPSVLTTALASKDSVIFERGNPSAGGAEDHRGHLHAAVPGARLDRTLLRGGAIHRWRDDGVVAYARRLSRPRGDCRNAARAAGKRPHDPCRGLRLLRP